MGLGVTTADGYGEGEEEEDGMPRISASAVELDAARRFAAMMRARWVRGLRGLKGSWIRVGWDGKGRKDVRPWRLASVLRSAE